MKTRRNLHKNIFLTLVLIIILTVIGGNGEEEIGEESMTTDIISNNDDDDNKNTSAKNQPAYVYGTILVTLSENSTAGETDPVEPTELCMIYPSAYYNITKNKTLAASYVIQDHSEIDLCYNDTGSISKSENNVLIILKASKCSIRQKLEAIANKNITGGLLLVSDYMYNFNQTYGLEVMAIVKTKTNWEVLQKPGVQVKLTDLDFDMRKTFDWSLIALWIIAVFCVFVGSFTGPYQFMKLTSSARASTGHEALAAEAQDQPKPPPTGAAIDAVTVPVAITLVAFISATLLLLYFFYQYLVFFFIGVFCLASARAVYLILDQIFKYFVKFEFRQFGGFFTLPQFGFAIIGLTLAILWFIYRHTGWVWVLQDILGICFCIHFIQILHLPNMKVITILLTLLFIYDIFFVFITPYFTKDGKSVMVEVATGVTGSGSEETLPMLFKFPNLRLLWSAASICIGKQYSMLGYGDIIVPGFLVCFAHTFDIKTNARCRPYFTASMIAYTLGVGGAFVALLLSNTGQPALLYIVPAVLLSIFGVGFYKKEVKHLWTGTIERKSIIVDVETGQ